MNQRIDKWLMDVAVRIVAPRVVVATLGGVVGILLDAGLLDGAMGAALLAVLSGS